MNIIGVLRIGRSAIKTNLTLLVLFTLSILSMPHDVESAGLIIDINGPKVCATAPVIQGLSADRNNIQARDHKPVLIAFTGKVVSSSECTLEDVTYEVIDEYGELSNKGQVATEDDKSFTVTLPMIAFRKGTDKDGRKYTIIFKAANEAGVGSVTETWSVTHDNRK